MKINITNKTRNLGVGYNCCSVNDNDGQWYIPDPTKPDYTGTVKQCFEQLYDDKFYCYLASSGTYYSTAWFYKHNGKWHKLNKRQFVANDLYDGYDMLVDL